MSYPPPPGQQPPPYNPQGGQPPYYQQPGPPQAPYGQQPPQQPYGQQTPPPFAGNPFQQPQPGGYPPPPPHGPNLSGKVLKKLLSIGGTVVLVIILIAIKFAFNGDSEKFDPTAADRGDKGEVTDPGRLKPEALRIGDCYKNTVDDTAGTEKISSVRAIPCSQIHDAQVFAEVTMSGAYPINDDVIGKRCLSQLNVWESRFPTQANRLKRKDNGINITYIYPDSLSWKSTGNTITCSIITKSGNLGPKLPTL